MAIVTESGESWYESLYCSNPVEWVKNNVIPYINKDPVSKKYMQGSLSKFINKFDELTIIADWPDDIKYFCEIVVIGPGLSIKLPKLKFEIIEGPNMEDVSKVPHNALSDAKAIAEYGDIS